MDLRTRSHGDGYPLDLRVQAQARPAAIARAGAGSAVASLHAGRRRGGSQADGTTPLGQAVPDRSAPNPTSPAANHERNGMSATPDKPRGARQRGSER